MGCGQIRHHGDQVTMLSLAEKIAILKETELLSHLPTEDLEAVATVAEEMHFVDSQTIFNVGEAGDAVYFVSGGEVKAHKSGVEIVRIGQNECVGEMAVMDAGPRSASVSSIGDSVLLRVCRDDLYRCARDNVKLLQNAHRTVVRKLRRDTDRQIEVIRRNERMMQDMVRARELQMCMLPTEGLRVTTAGPSCLEASGHCHPAEMVGGDYYDYFLLPDDHVGIVIGDVMGHGFHTGLMVSTAKSCLYTQIRTDYSVPSVMSTMNDMVYGFVHSDLFMSFCYVTVDLNDHTMSFSNAGHPYPYHYRASTKQLDSMESNACLLGVLEHQEYEVTQLEWNAGDNLVFFSDGITEAQNRKGEDFGTERLERLIVGNAHLSAAELKAIVLQELDEFCQDVVQTDDVSLVVAKMT